MARGITLCSGHINESHPQLGSSSDRFLHPLDTTRALIPLPLEVMTIAPEYRKLNLHPPKEEPQSQFATATKPPTAALFSSLIQRQQQP